MLGRATRKKPTTATRPAPRFQVDSYAALAGELATLDPARIIARGLELALLVSGAERSYLIGSGADPHLEPLLTAISQPELKVSRRLIERALETGETIDRLVGKDADPTDSMQRLGLRRVWVTPIVGPDGRRVAALYLDSSVSGLPFDSEVEGRLQGVARHIGMALANGSLYSQVVALNRTLEERVAERTRQLERSQAQLISQDRLVTLGRLVAAIAHELNNPAGAIVSFAGTLNQILAPVIHARQEIDSLFLDAERRQQALGLLEAVADASATSLDTGRRRALEQELASRLAKAHVPSADLIAQRLARIGVAPEQMETALGALAAEGARLSVLCEQLGSFRRGLATIALCGGNIARIVDGLKTYAHLDRAEAEVVDIHRSIQAALAVLGPRVPAGVQLVTRFGSLPPFLHRPGELTQVWTNLVDNALRAMGEEGQLTIETRDLGDRVSVSVADTGGGIPESLRDHIFELDVTSRGPGSGLGLGLAICRAIVERTHRGRIGFVSRPGETVFTVELPKAGPTPAGGESS